jgi:hypothetical protein
VCRIAGNGQAHSYPANLGRLTLDTVPLASRPYIHRVDQLASRRWRAPLVPPRLSEVTVKLFSDVSVILKLLAVCLLVGFLAGFCSAGALGLSADPEPAPPVSTPSTDPR